MYPRCRSRTSPVGQVRAETHGTVGISRVLAASGGGRVAGGGGHKKGDGDDGREGASECPSEYKGAGDGLGNGRNLVIHVFSSGCV